jgi:hypothetical protein
LTETRYRPVWLAVDTPTQVEVMTFWSRHGFLPRGADPAARIAQLCVLAHADDGVLVGVSTIQIRPVALLRARLAMFRCAVAPDRRRAGVATQLVVRSKAVLEAWALANPEREVLGMGCVVQGAELETKQSQPLWPLSELGVAGFNARGEQLRVAWFAHAMV